MIRKKWSNAAYQAGSSGNFDLEEAMKHVDEDVYKAAVQACAQPMRQDTPASSNAKGLGKGFGKPPPRQFDGQCAYCQKFGHRKQD